MKYLKISLFIFLLWNNSGFPQEYQTKSELENEILGTWFLKNDSESKLIFKDNGVMEQFYDGQLQSKNKYEITNSCEGEKLKKGYFLKVEQEEGVFECSYIENINYKHKKIFSIMTKSQGKIVIYKHKDS